MALGKSGMMLLCVLSMTRLWLGFVALAGDRPVSIQPRANRQVRERTVEPNLRVDTSLVLIPVSVTDPLNRPVTGLDKSSFRIFEGKQEQQLVSLAFEDTPLAVAVVFDSSRSMDRKITKARLAVTEFLRVANPEDEFCLVEFNSTARLAVPLTTELQEIRTEIAYTTPRGQTALVDAVAMALRELKRSHKPRKALLIFSDGGDNSSRYTESELRTMARESDVMIYAIGMVEPGTGNNLTIEEITGPRLLEEITELSGGRFFRADNPNEIPEIAARIGVELHNRYVLAYSPARLGRDGKYHRVSVRVAPPDGMPSLRVDCRRGYRAPND